MDSAINMREQLQAEFNREYQESGYALASVETRDVSAEQRERIRAAFTVFCGEVQAAIGC